MEHPVQEGVGQAHISELMAELKPGRSPVGAWNGYEAGARDG